MIVIDRRCWLEQFTPIRVHDTAITEFVREHVRVHPDPALKEGMAKIKVISHSGQVYEQEVPSPKGAPANPLARTDIVEKFRLAAAPALPRNLTDQAIELVTNLETVASLVQAHGLPASRRSTTQTIVRVP